MKTVESLIIGTGFSGIGMATQLKKAGVDDFLVIEKADDIGGAWRENTYPGCACDVESHLYSFSFNQNPNWSRMYAPQPEIKQYLKDTAQAFGVMPHIQFGHGVETASYSEDSGRWSVLLTNGNRISARNLITGIGALHLPNRPKIKGLSNFKGKVFHSSEWDHSFDYANKRVAVIGTGASAIQFVPQLAKTVQQLTLFQRSAPWVLPKPDRNISGLERKLFNGLPSLQNILRNGIYWRLESRALAMVLQPRLLTALEPVFARHLKKQVKDPVLRKKLTPESSLGCKRILISNDYYPALSQANVSVETSGIQEVKSHSVVDANGVEHEVDAIIFGTGFKTGEALTAVDIQGKHGKTLKSAWQDGDKTYAGVSVSGFPNFYMLMGPNTGLGHNSFIYMIESQVQYILDAIKKSRTLGWKSVDLKPEMQAQFVNAVQKKSANKVWTSGCNSWYVDDKGRNWALWPDFTFKYRWGMRKFNHDNYHIEVGA